MDGLAVCSTQWGIAESDNSHIKQIGQSRVEREREREK